METVYDICCGIDVHKKLLVACLKIGRKQEMRQTGATTREILELADWLKENGCQMVAMESTGSYWKPLYNILETNEIATMVVNASHMKAVPGRKTDVKDAEWIADLLQHGLLKASFIPDKAQRELRELVGYRKSLIVDRTRELNRLQKMLEGANIKLSGTVKDINGMSARNILNYLVTGQTFDQVKYDEMLANHQIARNLKATKEQIIDDMNGVMSPLQCRLMRELLGHLDELNKHIENLNDEIDHFMTPEEHECAKKIEVIPGIGHISAEAIIAVIGTDMSRFPTDRHISSWAGVCPENNESAGKRLSGKTRKGNSLLRTTLVVCAHSAVTVKSSYFHALYQRICAHRGKKRAYLAVAHSILVAIYHVLRDDVPYRDLGADYYNQFNTQAKINACLKKLKALGWTEPTATAVAPA